MGSCFLPLFETGYETRLWQQLSRHATSTDVLLISLVAGWSMTTHLRNGGFFHIAFLNLQVTVIGSASTADISTLTWPPLSAHLCMQSPLGFGVKPEAIQRLLPWFTVFFLISLENFLDCFGNALFAFPGLKKKNPIPGTKLIFFPRECGSCWTIHPFKKRR